MSNAVNVDRERREPRPHYTAMDIIGQQATAPDETEEVAERRRRFRAALALAGRNALEFAKELGVHESHLQQVLSRRRESVRVNEAIEHFIAGHPGVASA